MQALWLENGRLHLRRDHRRPVPPPGEALVRVRLAGVCGTDLELVRGYMPFTGIPGHEFVGEVVEEKAGEPSLAGQRVVGEINATCGACPACVAGRPRHCERRTVLGIVGRDGVFAEFLTLPVQNLLPVPERVPDEAAVFTEPLAAALEIQEQVSIGREDRVLVLGAGRLGQLIARTLALAGCRPLVAARHPAQRDLLAKIGIETVGEDRIPTRTMDVVIEATGDPRGFALAREAVRPHGTIVLKSTYRDRIEVDVSAVVVDEITLVGSRCGPFAPALELLASGRIDPVPLITARYPLRESIAAFEHAARPGVLKVLVEP